MSMAFNPKPVFLGETAGFSVKREKPSGTGVSSGIWAMKDSDPDPLSRDRLFQNFLAGENPRFFVAAWHFSRIASGLVFPRGVLLWWNCSW
jgi:hypothetical protein